MQLLLAIKFWHNNTIMVSGCLQDAQVETEKVELQFVWALSVITSNSPFVLLALIRKYFI